MPELWWWDPEAFAAAAKELAALAPVSDGETVTVPWDEGAFSWVNGRWQKLKERDG